MKRELSKMMRSWFLLSGLAALCATAAAAARDFPVDAPADGRAAGTAIQQAVDAANAAGGGRVVVRKGVHPCGTLHLRSDVELHLEEGAVLLGGESPEDYEDICDPFVDIAPEHSRKVFLSCIDATNVSVTGSGVVDGRGVVFYDPTIRPGARFFSKPPIPRPRMVQFFRVSNVRFEGVTLKDSPGWTVWLRECEDIAFERVKIVGDQRMINNDGIDFDACRRMTVTDCDISTGDDCLVMRAMRSGGRPAVCEGLTVRNCRLSSACQGVRLGCPSDDTIRSACFENCTFRGYNGILSQHPYRYLRPDDEGHCRMADIHFSGWDIDCAGSPIAFKVEGGIRLRDFGHVSFKDMKIKARYPIRLIGSAETPLRDIRFENVTAEIADGEAIDMNATEGIVFDRFSFTSGPGKAMPFSRPKDSKSWETKRTASLAATNAVTPLSPKDGETVPLLTERQREFVRLSREERAVFFDDARPEMERNVREIGYLPRPVTLRWKELGEAEVTVAKKGDAKPFFETRTATNCVCVWNLEIGATYVWTVRRGEQSASSEFHTEDLAPRLIRIPGECGLRGVPNFRDMGGRRVASGRRVRQGLAYRSAGLNDNASTNGTPGRARLTGRWRRYIVDTLGIRTDIDLRSDRERFGMTGSPLGPSVRFVHDWNNYNDYSKVHREGKEATRKIFRLLMDRDSYPLVFHCIGGADRTGTVATLLHGVLGASDEDIWLDYQITAWYGSVNDARHMRWFSKFISTFDKFEGATLSQRICAYFRSIGFTDADLDRIRSILLEP